MTDDFNYDFGEAYGQQPASWATVHIFLENEIGCKHDEVEVIMRNLYPNTESVAHEIWQKWKDIQT